MLELDLLLVPFMESEFRKLELEDQDRFVSLLDCEDQELFLWFMKREVPLDPNHQRIVKLILDFTKSTKRYST